MSPSSPLVSAVIPTRSRPEMVVRAVRSVLSQTYPNVEAIVVIDGPDIATANALADIDDARLQVVSLPESVGGAEARNIGVRRSSGEWVGFLDDDDEWLPTKTEEQLRAVEEAKPGLVLVSSQVIARTSSADLIWPEKPPREPYSDYLIVRSCFSYGEGVMQTSSLLASRELLERVPFKKGLRKHQDFDWVLRCTHIHAKVVYVPKPLAIWNVDENRARISKGSTWQYSLDWIRSAGQLVTKRAYAAFIAVYVVPAAARDHAWGQFFPLLKEMILKGSPRVHDIVAFLGAWLVPLKFHHRLRKAAHARAAVLRGRA
jgi:glycosyltransferase involved in cell wall biosynthesis